MIKAIIFDCFGVIRTDAFDEAYRSVGGDPNKDRQFIIKAVNETNTGKVERYRRVFAEHLGVSEAEWGKAIESFGRINMELLDYVKELRQHYKTAMLSNIGKGGLERYFKPGFLDEYFDAVVASGDIGFAKPEARAYEITADRLGLRLEECVFTDDRVDYVEGAKSVGMKAIVYKDFKNFKKELTRVLNHK